MSVVASEEGGRGVVASLSVRPAWASPLWLSEVIVGGLVVAVALLAWVSLALAHLGAHGLLAVAGVCAAVVAVVGVAATRLGRARRPGGVRVRVDRVGLAGVAALTVLAAVMFFPGFHYGASDKDPGGYVAHAMEIARTGDYTFYDAASDPSRMPYVQLASQGARFPGVWLHDTDMIVPQFYHLWPALLATSYDLAGERGLANTGPLCGVLAVCALALAVRRAVAAALGAGQAPSCGGPSGGVHRLVLGRVRAVFGAVAAGLHERAELAGLFAGGAVGLMLATNMLEVWQAKYPTAEISAQLFFVGALLGLVVAVTTGWRPAAGGAGALAGIGFLDRADNLLLLLLAAGFGALLVALRRFDGRAGWFAAGLGVVLPHALWQAYSLDAARRYTVSTNLPTLAKVAMIIAALYVVAVPVRFAVRPLAAAANRLLSAGQAQRRAGAVVFVAVAGLLALGFLRPRFFGADYAVFGNQGLRRTYDEQALNRLGWFVSRPAFLLALLGFAAVALRRWSAALWTLAVPLLALLPVYAWHTRNSTRLMWWSRRYLPTVLPALLALVAVAVGVGLLALAAHRWVPRVALGVPALAVCASLTGFFLNQSLPLRHHDELGGSFAITRQLAALPGEGVHAVYLWPQQPCCLTETALFPGALWLGRGQMSALLPNDRKTWAAYIGSFQKAFPGSPVFVIGHGASPPRSGATRLAPVRHFAAVLPYWQESEKQRPDHAVFVPVDFTVWRVTSNPP